MQVVERRDLIDSAVMQRACTGAAWLSSARVVRCWVKSRNERNPYCQLLTGELSTLARLPPTRRRKVGTTSSHHGLYAQGYTRATMAGTDGSLVATLGKSSKAGPSSDCSLQLDYMKPESLVIAGQHTAVNVFLSLVHTARQATKAGGVRSRRSNLYGAKRRR